MHDTTAWHWPEVPPSSDLISLPSTASSNTGPEPTPTSTITPESAATQNSADQANQQPGEVGALALTGSSGEPVPADNGSFRQTSSGRSMLMGVAFLSLVLSQLI